MPRVSEEYLERRRQQILDAARTCFVRKGFYETSMQDIFKESGLSAGAVYRYFKSKDDLVHAIAEDISTRFRELMEEVVQEDPLPSLDDVAVRLAEQITRGPAELTPARMAPLGWAASLHDERIHAAVTKALLAIRDLWATYARRMRDEGRLPADADIDAVSKVLFCIAPGFILQYLLLGDIAPETLRTGLQNLHAASLNLTTSPTSA